MNIGPRLMLLLTITVNAVMIIASLVMLGQREEALRAAARD
jgi:hypothetical protein